jgi:hypothetical protein
MTFSENPSKAVSGTVQNVRIDAQDLMNQLPD